MIDNNSMKSTNYFLSGPNCDMDKMKSAELTQQINREFNDVFNGIWCFEGMFSLQLKPDSGQYQALPRCIVYALQTLFRDELERLQQQDIIGLLGVDETVEWFNSFVLVPKAIGKVRLCLDPAWLNQALIRAHKQGAHVKQHITKT